MAKNLAKHGWQYIVIDVKWYESKPQTHGGRPNAGLSMDEHGRLTPALSRFPSATGGKGLKPLADYVHGRGLKFGIHIMRGIPRRAVDANLRIQGSKYRAADVADKTSLCLWNTDMYGIDLKRPGGQDYYDSILRLYASWDVDFTKADNMLDGNHTAEVEGFSAAVRKAKRPIVLSLSPGPAQLATADLLAKNS